MTDIVLVIGPPLAGAGAVASALRPRLDRCVVVEPADLVPGRIPDAVVFVTSAAAPMSGCDAALLADAAARTDAVVAAVTKIDLHRTWRAVLDANRRAAQRPPVGRVLPWVGVAADPEVGPVVVGRLADAVRGVLDDDNRRRRNNLRARQWAVQRRIADHQRQVARQMALRARAARRTAVRARVLQARLDLAARVRAGSAGLRSELQRDAAGLSPTAMRHRAHQRAQHTVEEFDRAAQARIAAVSAVAGTAVRKIAPAPPLRLPPLPGASQEDRLTAVLGTGFGLGVALTLGRSAAGLVPGAPGVTLSTSAAAGLALAVWVVRTRRSVTARAALQRWAVEVASAVRGALEQRLLAAESALLAAPVDGAGDGHQTGDAPAASTVQGWIAELAQVRAALGENPD